MERQVLKWRDGFDSVAGIQVWKHSKEAKP